MPFDSMEVYSMRVLELLHFDQCTDPGPGVLE